MELLERYNEAYLKLGHCVNKYSELLRKLSKEGYKPEKEKSLRNSLLQDSNNELKEILDEFFTTFGDLQNEIERQSAAYTNISEIPGAIKTETDDYDVEDEKTVLRKIESLLERQNISRKLEKMNDTEILQYYKDSVRKAENLRDGLFEKTRTGLMNIEEAKRVLNIDTNVKVTSIIENEYDYFIKNSESKQVIENLIDSHRNNRLKGNEPEGIKQQVEKINSSATFLLRDMNDTNLEVRDWRNSELVIDDFSSNQVDYFLRQFSELSGYSLEEIKPPGDDNVSKEAGRNTKHEED